MSVKAAAVQTDGVKSRKQEAEHVEAMANADHYIALRGRVFGASNVTGVLPNHPDAQRTFNMQVPTLAQPRSHLIHALCLGFAFSLTSVGTVLAQDAPVRPYEIPAGSVINQVNRIAQENGFQVVYAEGTGSLRSRSATSLGGEFTLRDALDRVLADSGLAFDLVNNDTIVVKKAGAPTSAPPEEGPAPQGRGNKGAADKKTPEPVPTKLSTVSVTGTHIRGAHTSSPTIEIDAADIKIQGFSDLGEALRAMPQNFRGGENPGAVRVSSSLGRAENGNQAGGSALNLRGLGPGASLTLLNGRRMSYGGDNQAVDVTPIPVDAVERVEIVTDGASAIYGSDAVAGVGNVILKRDFEGVALRADQGTATRGGLTTRNYSLTAGKVWSSGNVLFAYTDASRDAIYAHQRDYAKYMGSPYTIFPNVKERSGLLNVHQTLGKYVDFEIDALSSRRRQVLSSAYSTDYMSYLPRTKSDLLAPAINFWLPGDWRLSASGSWGKNLNTQVLTITDLATNETEPYSRYDLDNRIRMYQVDAEGPIFSLGGGEARLAVGAGHRENEFHTKNHMYDNQFGGKSKSNFAFAELNLPFIDGDSGVTGVESLVASIAVRTENYSDYGRVTTPKIGVIYSPNKDFTIKGTWGKSFKTPTLSERFQGKFAWISWASNDGYQGDPDEGLVDMYVTGGNPDLGPERARTWTTTVAFHPEAIPGLRLEVTGFDIDYTNRIVEPIPNSQFALSNPVYADFIQLHPTRADYDAIAGQVVEVDNWDNIPYDPGNLYAIIYDHLVNAERQRIRGVDLTGSQTFKLGPGELALSGTISWLDSNQTTVPGQSSQQLSGMIYNPAKHNARIGAVWSVGGFSAAGFVNHTGGGLDNYWMEDQTAKLSSFNTVDLTFRYETGAEFGAWADMAASLSVRNAFDRAPPFLNAGSKYVLPYDATNASPIGRYVSLGLSKKW